MWKQCIPMNYVQCYVSADLYHISSSNLLVARFSKCLLALSRSYFTVFSFFFPSFLFTTPSFYLFSAQYSQDQSNRVQLKYPFSMKPPPPSPQDGSSTFSSELVWHFSVVPLMQASLFDSLTLCAFLIYSI